MLSKHLREPTFADSCGSGTLGDGKVCFPEEMHRLINQLGIQEGEGDPATERREEYPLGPVM